MGAPVSYEQRLDLGLPKGVASKKFSRLIQNKCGYLPIRNEGAKETISKSDNH